MITIETSPVDFGRIYDTNRLMYKLSSTEATRPNFRFYISVGYYPADDLTFTPIGNVRKRPLADGTCFFNPAELWGNKLSSDLQIDITTLQECLNSNAQFQLIIFEEYGEPPELVQASIIETELVMLYNGLQEYIPYDIEVYGGGNMQWVMSGVTTSTSAWRTCGTFSYGSPATTTGHIFFEFEHDVSDITDIGINYIDLSGINVRGCLDSIPIDTYIKFADLVDVDNYVIFSAAHLGNLTYNKEFSDLSYVMAGAHFNVTTGFSIGTKVVVSFSVLPEDTTGTGRYLTDALDFQVSEDDYSNLYFIASKEDRPVYARITVRYWNEGVAINNGGGGLDMMSYVQNANTIVSSKNSAESAPNPTTRSADWADDIIIKDPGEPVKPVFRNMVSTYTTGFDLSYTNDNNQMYYIPTGPKELDALGIFDHADANGGWLSYDINLTDGYFLTKIYNKYPMNYYRKDKCDKYGPWQLFWLNPHGGFDTYTFYKKNYIEYDITQTRWEHRFSDTYVLGERGTTVYKTLANKKVVLNTDYLSASEVQILSQLNMSPEIYATYEYLGVIYKIPYVISDTKFQYKDKKNEKMVSMDITIVPAWNRVSQTS
jgi:hypothetical protein